jgi:7,8-dihydroneopterin aldolase/epimerase/oxygenase
MGLVVLEGMEFFAHHGFYDEEQKIGNKYGVDVYVTTDFKAASQTDDLKKTVNYEVVYKIVSEVMTKKHRLLEHVGGEIIAGIRRHYPEIENIKVNVSKFNPPVGGICYRSMIQIEG